MPKDEDDGGSVDGEGSRNGRKGIISRVNRACNHCRRMKMRCVGGDDPPCKRCRHAGLDCVLERPEKVVEPAGDERLRSLEHQVSSINSTLTDLVRLLQPALPRSLEPRPSTSSPAWHSQPDWSSLHSARPSDSVPTPEQIIGVKRNPSPSLPPSRAMSVGPEDVLGEGISRPLEAMSNMAGLVEAAMERAREEHVTTIQPSGKIKRARFASPEPRGPSIIEHASTGKSEPVIHVHAYPDAVADGLVSEEEGREMMQIFFSGCSDFMPCFDPNMDTWESLRRRSPFCITTIIMIGARVRDGGGPPSDTQLACRAHAQRIASGTLFARVPRVEAVQAMSLLATFSDRGWLPGGHAVRLALDMGLDQAFGQLLRTGMGLGKSRPQLETERHLVVQSRVWFCLYLFEHQMAYGNGRPAILREDESIKSCRRLLEHPLSIASDARLVSMVELTALRAPLHSEIISSLHSSATESILNYLIAANNDFEAWEKDWLVTFMSRQDADSFVYESLAIQRQYAELFANSQLLRDIREPQDVFKLGMNAQAFAIQSIRNAERCIEICLRNDQYRHRLKYAVHYTHVCAAFAASFLMRITRLFPDEVDFEKTMRDVKELADLLSEIPAPRYGRSLKLLLRRARRRLPAEKATLLPFPSLSPSDSAGVASGDLDTIFGQGIPLFLDDQSLGAPSAPAEAPYAGMEDFFLPTDFDTQLVNLTGTPQADSGPWW
ncbi:hypothetical protein BD324DRAFT_615541 [Kockovaella imperatae]|uniref:Zn(2)-C6 fungal-type domain-containing protein n=1 Tax=Kockovaella imperatae TaxID=4999 RepID=A0A1Y1UPH9_9TREE|nr:hypothetical protein BD324DRAFT_615541 [Kockovaella imperatae]ORX39923.1 hypothetical protein BD324DRAFT_615541 [Kockovaella imperatae]